MARERIKCFLESVILKISLIRTLDHTISTS